MDAPRDMSASLLFPQTQIGAIARGEIISFSEAINEGIISEYYFSVQDGPGFFTEVSLSGLQDDLDLTLSRSYNGFYLPFSDSEHPGIDQEYIGKFLTPGDYLVEVKYYESVNGGQESQYNLSIDTKSFNASLPNDPLFNNQWYLFNTGQANGIENEDIFAPEAWAIRATSPDVIVGVIDTGIQLDHPDLKNNIWVNKLEIPGNNIDDDNNGYIDDINGWNFVANNHNPFPQVHGTHVAGTIGAEGDNDIGVAGVTWDVQLMSLDTFGGGQGSLQSDEWKAIYYAVNNGASVINMSLGSTYSGTYQDFQRELPEIDQGYKNAFEYAINNGTTVVIAAGNEEANFDQNWLSIPAYYSELYDGVISVASVSNTGDKAAYTNYGSQVSLAAPGGEMFFQGDPGGIYNVSINNSYDFLQGTSMASPVVAGAIALMLGENPYLNPFQVESILQDTAFKYRFLESTVKDGSYLNVEAALQRAGELAEKTVVRLYNSATGKHLFSSNENEIDILTKANWKNEGALYYSPDENTAEVFRFYIPEQGRHFYTALESERDLIIGNSDLFSGWEYEGAAFSAYSNSDYIDGAVAVVRYLNIESGSHVYSTSTYEQGLLDQNSLWLNEGIAWYGDPMA